MLEELYSHFPNVDGFGELPVNSNILSDFKKVSSVKETIALLSLTHEAKGLDAEYKLRQRIQSLSQSNFK